MDSTADTDRKARALGFLWIVQTGLLAIAGRVRRADTRREMVAEYSGTGTFIHIDEAVRAAGRIPADMPVAEAAEAFCAFFAEAKRSRDVPHWFARYGAEKHDYTAIEKPDQFLWMVQTSLLANAEKQAAVDPDDEHDPVTTQRAMAEAIRVAALIPTTVDATEAASEFLAHYAPGMKERRTPPKWCAGKR